MKFCGDFKCPDCGGLHEIIGILYKEVEGETFIDRWEYCPCNRKTATQVIDMDVPEGYEFSYIAKGKAYFFNKMTGLFINIKLPHKLGDEETFTCDKCDGSGEENCANCIERKGCGNNHFPECMPCPSCKGSPTLRAKVTDIQVKKTKKVEVWKEDIIKHQLIETWEKI